MTTYPQTTGKARAHHHPVRIMGCGFVISAIHDDPQKAWDGIRLAEYEMKRIEYLISSWRPESETSRINDSAGIAPVSVSEETFGLIDRSLKVSDLTQGAFDISGTLARDYWIFDRQDHSFPSASLIDELKFRINYHNIILDRSKCSVYLAEPGMKIGFGGIGKGYAARKAMELMKNFGIPSGLINASGDLVCWGIPPGGTGWSVKIPDPVCRQRNLLEVGLDNGAVVTSGSFENYTLIDGRRYSHIINPRTGIPVTHTQNVTVMSPDPEFADAFATALSVMDIDQGLSLADRLNGVEAIIIDEENQIYYSKNASIQCL